MSDVITEEERHEAATEEPTTVGCPSLGLRKLPGGFDGVERGEDAASTDVEELKRRGAKLKACNDRSYAKMNEIARIASECVQRTTHEAYMAGQYGEDYRAFGKAMGEIRKLVGDSIADGKVKLPKLEKRCAKTPQTIVFETIRPSGVKLSAEWEAEATGRSAQAFLYRDDKCVCQIRFFNDFQTRYVGRQITKQALNGLCSVVGHAARWRKNRKAKKGGAA